jgi:hypothetical protein
MTEEDGFADAVGHDSAKFRVRREYSFDERDAPDGLGSDSNAFGIRALGYVADILIEEVQVHIRERHDVMPEGVSIE